MSDTPRTDAFEKWWKVHIKLAQQAFIDRGFGINEAKWECWKDAWLAGAFADRKACGDAVAKERERCAKVCEARAGHNSMGAYQILMSAADAIRKGE